MNRRLRRTGTRIGVALYFVWLLAVVVLISTEFTPGSAPTIVDWVVTGGVVVSTVLGVVLLAYRTPQYAEKLRGWLS